MICTTRLTVLLAVSAILSAITGAQDEPVQYGVDVSFPTHSRHVSTNYPWLPHNVDPENNPTPEEYEDMPIQPLGNKKAFYDHFMEGCREHYGERGHLCDATENDRVAMSLRQPQSMRNYTDTGFKKIRAPENLFKLLKNHFDLNHKSKKEEKFYAGFTYTNHWESPQYMVSVEDSSLIGGGYELKQKIWDAARPILEEWTGQRLKEASLYGIRIYTGGAVLTPHVDRMPLISSCIINVAQDVDEDWPLEVIDRNGMAVNVTMKPGDMVLYESHSLIHHRPFPMKGRYFANIFIHFEPDVEETDEPTLPVYILEDSPEAKLWYERHGGTEVVPSVTSRKMPAHEAAIEGDLGKLEAIAEENIDELHAKDENGWQPLHEATRAGHVGIVEFLLDNGGDVNERTNHGVGGSPLWLALQSHSASHEMVRFLKRLGAINIGPDL